MDVLLDSNFYLQDVKLEGNQFTELFTYLRRTGSRILLPHLVREEVSASRYKLWDATRKLESSRENLSKVKITAGPHFGSIDFDHELKLIDEKMHSPSKGVQVIDIDQYGGVDVKDVVIQGVRRKRPADENGEELRDVILWLLAIDLAKKSEAGIIFISNDKGFKGEDGRLHPDLVREVSLLKPPLEFYAEIRECVVAKALSQKPVDRDDLSSLIPIRKLEHLSLELILRSQIPMGRIVGADIKELDFEEGTNYTVGQVAQFIEVRFHGSAIIIVEEFTQIFSPGSYSIDMSGGTYLADHGQRPRFCLRASPLFKMRSSRAGNQLAHFGQAPTDTPNLSQRMCSLHRSPGDIHAPIELVSLLGCETGISSQSNLKVLNSFRSWRMKPNPRIPPPQGNSRIASHCRQRNTVVLRSLRIPVGNY